MKLFFYFYRIEGFLFSLIYYAFVFYHVLTFVRFIGVYYTFGLLDCVRCNEDFVISRFAIWRFCTIHFIVT